LWIKTGIVNVMDALCIGFVSTTYQAASCFAVVSCFALIGQLFVFCYAKKVTVKPKDNDSVAPGEMSEQRKLDEA